MALFAKFHTDPQRYDETESVLANLRALLSTRRGYGSFIQDFGLPDVSGMEDQRRAARQMEEELRALISRYEPRLRDVVIKLVEAPESARLTLSMKATLGEDPRVFYVSLDPRTASVDVRADGGGSRAARPLGD